MGDSEGPALQARAERHDTLGRIQCHVFHLLILVSHNELITLSNRFLKVSVRFFASALQFGNNSVYLIKHKNRYNTLTKGLS